VLSGSFRSCVAGIEPAALPLLIASLTLIGSSEPAVLGEIDVTAIGTLEPELLVMNVDALTTDPLEVIRMTRFLLRSSIIAIFTARLDQWWVMSCHVAGANCLLSSTNGEDRTALGLLHAIRGGCFTDRAFDAA
jgi:DNA-binding NarL/FixJ family response regulator